MTEQTVKHVESILNYVKGEIFRSVSDEDAILYSNWIKSSILNSELNNIFNLSDIDWDKADEFATNNLVKEICNFYNLNKNLSQKDICYKFKISHGTLIKYLKKGGKANA